MGQVISGTWALMLGMMLLMVGNGVQGSLLGIRGEIEGFSTVEMSFVMSAYFLGFLGGSRVAPEMIRRVGHVRVFAALGSFISAALIVFPWLADPWVWMFCRAVIGFCFCGVYVTAETKSDDRSAEHPDPRICQPGKHNQGSRNKGTQRRKDPYMSNPADHFRRDARSA